MNGKNEIIVYCDGAARGNPGPAAAGLSIHGTDGDHTLGFYLGTATNNQAEYSAVLAGLSWLQEYCSDHDVSTANFILDSELVVKQLKGVYKVKNATLKKMYRYAKQLEGELDAAVSYQAVRRKKNQAADRVANQVLDITRTISRY